VSATREPGAASYAGPGESGLRRLHPLTPLLRGWKWYAALGVLGGRELYGDVDVRTFLVGLVVLLPVAAAYGYVSWRFTRYRVDGEALRMETGVLFRRSRQVRLDRLQAVDVVRPLLARALGLAELRLEVVGGGSSEAPLAYLSEADAHRLRAELLARAAGLRPDTPEAPERVLLQVPPMRLVAAGLLTGSTAFGVLALVAALVAVAAGRFVALGLVLPAVLGAFGPAYAGFVRHFGFTVAQSPDGLRLRSGLLETRAQTVPPGRVQAVRVVRPWLWRLGGDWVRVEVNVAGYTGEQPEATSVLLPVGPAADARAVLALALPGVDVDAVPLVPAPVRARWLDPVAWRRLAAGADDRVFASRRGVLRAETDVVPHAKTQSLRWTQGPVQRRLGLATVHLDSTPGPVRPMAAHRDAAEALALLAAQAERARVARAGAAPERWMTG
jgi:putative membrane protein